MVDHATDSPDSGGHKGLSLGDPQIPSVLKRALTLSEPRRAFSCGTPSTLTASTLNFRSVPPSGILYTWTHRDAASGRPEGARERQGLIEDDGLTEYLHPASDRG